MCRKALSGLIILSCMAAILSAAETLPNDTWVNIDPGGGGAFFAAGGGPTGIILAGSDLSGGYVSYDKGASWECLGFTRGVDSAHCCGVGFDPDDENIMYLGTGGGIFRSSDRGKTFKKVARGGYFFDIIFVPDNPNIGYVGYGPQWDAPRGQVYKTSDRGLTWAQVSKDLPDGLIIQRLYVYHGDENLVYGLSTPKFNGKRAIFKSVNGGVNWTQVGADLTDVNDFATDPLNKQVLYATSAGKGIFKSADNGQTWNQIGDVAGKIFVNFKTPSTVRIVNRKGAWESLDAGKTWTQKSKEEDWNEGWSPSNKFSWWEKFCTVVSPDLSSPDNYYWVTDQFIYGSFDGAKTFKALHTRENPPGSGTWRTAGANNTEVYAVEVSAANPDDVYLGFWDMGLWRSKNGGESWRNSNKPELTGAWRGRGGNSRSILADPTRRNVVWAAIQDNGIAKSTDGGTPESWIVKSPKGTALGLSMDRSSPDGKRILFGAIDNSIYRSTDDGETWKAVCSPATGSATRATAVDNFNSKLVYAGGDGGVWKSLSGGDVNTWAEVSTPEMKNVYDIQVDPVHTGWVYAACYGDKRGLYRSKDQGKNWEKLYDDQCMRGVAIDPVDPDIIYATSSSNSCCGGSPYNSSGVVRSKDGGKTWTKVNEGLSWPWAWPIKINPQNPSQVYIGSPGTGFWKRIFTDRPTTVKATK